MKNINKIIVSLSLLAMVPVIAQQNGLEKPSITQIAKDTSKAVIQGAGTVIQAGGEVVKGAGKMADSGIMSFPYYFGSAVGYVGSGIKSTAFYLGKLPVRLTSWGIDGTFGDGTSAAVGSKVKTGLSLGLSGALLFGAYKGLNRFAKWFAISDIQKAFENGGEVSHLGNKIPLKYGSKTYKSLKEFYTVLATELRKRFEYTDLQAYIQKPLEKHLSITLVCDEIIMLIDESINGDIEHTIESICAIARRKVTNGLLGRFNLLNGYCHEALVLYAKIILAIKLTENNGPSEQKNQLKIEEEVLKHKDIFAKLNARISKKIVNK